MKLIPGPRWFCAEPWAAQGTPWAFSRCWQGLRWVPSLRSAAWTPSWPLWEAWHATFQKMRCLGCLRFLFRDIFIYFPRNNGNIWRLPDWDLQKLVSFFVWLPGTVALGEHFGWLHLLSVLWRFHGCFVVRSVGWFSAYSFVEFCGA